MTRHCNADTTAHKPQRVAPTNCWPSRRGRGVHPHRRSGRAPHSPPPHPNRQATTKAPKEGNPTDNRLTHGTGLYTQTPPAPTQRAAKAHNLTPRLTQQSYQSDHRRRHPTPDQGVGLTHRTARHSKTRRSTTQQNIAQHTATQHTPVGLAGGSEHPLGRTPRPPRPVAPGSLKKMAPRRPGRRLRPPPGQDSPSPLGRFARFSEDIGPPLAWQEAPNTPWAGLIVPPRPVRPVLRRRWPPVGLAGGSEHPLGRHLCPPQASAPGSPKIMAPHWPCRRLRPPPGLDSSSPPGRCARLLEDDGSPWALQEVPTTPWAGLPVPPRPVRPVISR